MNSDGKIEAEITSILASLPAPDFAKWLEIAPGNSVATDSFRYEFGKHACGSVKARPVSPEGD